MELELLPEHFFVFDLDDTLYPEIEFLHSGYRHIAGLLAPLLQMDIYPVMLHQYDQGENVFRYLVECYGKQVPFLTLEWLLKEYRFHEPLIRLDESTRSFLQQLHLLGVPAGLVTDGRSQTQRNKLKALGIESYFQSVVISEEFGSEKPDLRNFKHFEEVFPRHSFVFFGDNLNKDFVTPKKLGWKTVCLKDCGRHIHKQPCSSSPYVDYFINSFDVVILKINASV